MKSSEESGEPEKPLDLMPGQRALKQKADMLSVVSRWTRIAIIVAIAIFMIVEAIRVWNAVHYPQLH